MKKHPFNSKELEVINQLLSLHNEPVEPLQELMETLYFNHSNGKALIIQTEGNYAVFYLKKEDFHQSETREAAMVSFFELITLIQCLQRQGYLSIFRGPELRKHKMFYISNFFKNPMASKSDIILNAQGYHTNNPETILNKENEIVYEGIKFDGDNYDMILHYMTGSVIISDRLREAVSGSNQDRPNAKSSHHRNWVKTFFLTSIFLLLLSLNLFYFLKSQQFDHRLGSIIEHHKVLQSSMVNFVPKKDSTVQVANTNKHQPEKVKELKRKKFYGIDISKWNGNIVELLQKKDSISFVFCKATEGINLVDREFEQNWEALKDKKIIRGAYHFYIAHDNPMKQAKHFLETVGQLEAHDMPLVVDIEKTSIRHHDSFDKTSFHEELLSFLKHIESKSGKTPMIYTNSNFGNTYLLNNEFERFPLWIADYSSKDAPIIPKVWKQKGYRIWQKSDSYHIHSKTVDLDVYEGVIADLVR